MCSWKSYDQSDDVRDHVHDDCHDDRGFLFRDHARHEHLQRISLIDRSVSKRNDDCV